MNAAMRRLLNRPPPGGQAYEHSTNRFSQLTARVRRWLPPEREPRLVRPRPEVHYARYDHNEPESLVGANNLAVAHSAQNSVYD